MLAEKQNSKLLTEGRGQDRLVSWDRTLGIAQRWGPKPQPVRAVNFKKGA